MPAKTWNELMKEANEGSKEFALLEPKMYPFVIKDAAKVGQTSKGYPKFTINPSVESGERANARVWHDFSVSESPYAMKNFFFGDLAALGLNAEFFAANPTPEQIASALQGRRFVAEVFHETGTDNKVRARIRNFSEPVGVAPSANAGVPAGLPAPSAAPAAAPVAAPVPTVAAAPSANPWETAAPAPAPAGPSVPLPPPFGGQQ